MSDLELLLAARVQGFLIQQLPVISVPAQLALSFGFL